LLRTLPGVMVTEEELLSAIVRLKAEVQAEG
jgi:hypothetical protein